jgi:tetratricopeptide (TPR) repeat protein
MSNDAESFLRQAAEALKNKQYPTAEALQRKGCQLLREQTADESRVADEIEKLAGIHYVQHKFETAASEYEEVVKLRRVIQPANRFDLLRPLYGAAKSHFEGQNYEAAEAGMRSALSIAETRDDSPESLAFCLHELGWLLYYVGKYREAEPFLLKALSVSESSSTVPLQQKVKVLAAIALLYKNSPDPEGDPEPYFRRVLQETNSGEDLKETHVWNLCRLAGYIAERKRYDEADDLYLKLLTYVDKDQRDPEWAWIVDDCVKYFESRGKNEIVAHLLPQTEDLHVYEDMVRKRLEHAEQKLSEDDPELIEALLAAGNSATFEGKYEEAEPLLLRAVQISEKIHGENSSQTLFALNRACIVSRLLKKFDQADQFVKRALTIASDSFHDQGIFPWTFENLALLREAERRIGEATEAYEKAIAEFERTCGFPSYETAEALYHQSGYLLRAGDFNAAEKAISRAISVMDEVEHLSGYEKSDYLSTLASVLDATGRSGEATEMRSRAEELFQRAKRQFESEK